jgi:hypothetical protein
MSDATNTTTIVLAIAEAVDNAYFDTHPGAKVLHRPIIFGEDGFVADGSFDAFQQFGRYTVAVVKLKSGELFRYAIRPGERELDDLGMALILANEVQGPGQYTSEPDDLGHRIAPEVAFGRKS